MCIFKSCATHLIILASLFGLLSFASEAAPIYSDAVCTDGSYFRPNTTYEANLNTLLSSLVSNATLHNGFYRTAVARGSRDEVKGLFLCRGDITPAVCHDCVAAAAENITRHCTNQTESIIWYDVCMLRYSNLSFLNNIVPSVNLKDDNNVSVSDRDRFFDLLATTLNDLAEKAVSGNKFATEEVEFTRSQKLYTLAQCTPELSTSECNTCYRSAISDLPTCCNGTRGARVLLPSCNVRYELYPFYNVSALSTQPQPPPPSSGIQNSCFRVVCFVSKFMFSLIIAKSTFFILCFLFLRISIR